MLNPTRCPRHPFDRKPFAADPWLLAGWSRIVNAGQAPFAESPPGFAERSHAERMETLDVLCAVAQAIGVRFILQVSPGGRYVMHPDDGT